MAICSFCKQNIEDVYIGCIINYCSNKQACTERQKELKAVKEVVLGFIKTNYPHLHIRYIELL